MADDSDFPAGGEASDADRALPGDAADFFLEHHNAQLLWLANQRATALWQGVLGKHAITQRQFAVLATLLRHGGMSQINIGRITHIDTATLSPIVGRLKKTGMVERVVCDKDLRVNLIRLTQKGTCFVMDILPDAQAISDQMLAPLKSRDRDRFVEMLKLLI